MAAAAKSDPESGAARIGIGDTARASREALSRANIEQFLAAAKSSFDLILIDGGVLTGNLRIGPLASASDRLLIVAKNGATRQRDLLDILDVSEVLGRPVSGSLFVDRYAAAA